MVADRGVETAVRLTEAVAEVEAASCGCDTLYWGFFHSHALQCAQQPSASLVRCAEGAAVNTTTTSRQRTTNMVCCQWSAPWFGYR